MRPPDVAPLRAPPFKIDPTLGGITPQGEPWLRWAKLHPETLVDPAGWYAVGTRQEASPCAGSRVVAFWERAFSIAVETGNGALDAAHGVGAGILSAGGVGFTATGELPTLIGLCLQAFPEHVVASLMPAWRLTGAHPRQLDRKGGWKFADGDGVIARNHWQLEQLLRGDKSTGKEWVRCCSRLLRNEECDTVQQRHFIEATERVFDSEQRELTRWPRAGAGNTWTYTEEQQALWVITMLLSIFDRPSTTGLLRAVDAASSEAIVAICRMRDSLSADEHFGVRVKQVTDATARKFGLKGVFDETARTA